MYQQYDMFDDYEMPEDLLPPVVSSWEHYDEGSWEDCWRCQL